MPSRRRRRRIHTSDKVRTSPTQRMCTLKEQFKSEEEAQVEVDRIKRRVVYINGVGPRGELGAYRCRRCPYWHIGHSRPADSGGPRARPLS